LLGNRETSFTSPAKNVENLVVQQPFLMSYALVVFVPVLISYDGDGITFVAFISPSNGTGHEETNDVTSLNIPV